MDKNEVQKFIPLKEQINSYLSLLLDEKLNKLIHKLFTLY